MATKLVQVWLYVSAIFLGLIMVSFGVAYLLSK